MMLKRDSNPNLWVYKQPLNTSDIRERFKKKGENYAF
jgi:hypothetical protein